MKTLRTLFTMMLLVVASSMSAQLRMQYLDRVGVYADPVAVEPGKEYELVIYMEDNSTTENYTGWGFNLTLPDGISITTKKGTNSYGEYYYVPSSSFKVSEELHGEDYINLTQTRYYENNNSYYFAWYGFIDDDKPTMLSTNGELCRIKLNVSSTFVAGTGELTRINFTNSLNESFYYQDTEILFNGGESHDNTIYMDDVKVKAGTETALPIKMKNTADIRGFQFTLDLPDGVTPVKSAKGKIQASLTADRLPADDEHTLSVSENEDGTLLFTANSLYEETFTGTDGEVLTLRVNVASDMADGDYDVVVKNIRLNEKDATKYYDVTKMKSTLTVWSYILGDVNGDGDITVSDYIGVGNRIHNVAQEGFNEKAADVVVDGTINISDYVGVANLILTGNIHGTGAGARRSVKKANTDVSGIDNVLYVEPFKADAGQQAVLSVKMKNKAEIRGFQFDLTLPEGVQAVKGSNGRIQAKLAADRLPEEDEHTLMVTEQADGTLRFLCGSEYMETFTGNDGEILTLTLDIAADIANGEHSILLSNIKLGENDMNVSYSTDSVESTLTIGEGGSPEPIGKNGERWGDVNNDGSVDVSDIATIISIMAGKRNM